MDSCFLAQCRCMSSCALYIKCVIKDSWMSENKICIFSSLFPVLNALRNQWLAIMTLLVLKLNHHQRTAICKSSTVYIMNCCSQLARGDIVERSCALKDCIVTVIVALSVAHDNTTSVCYKHHTHFIHHRVLSIVYRLYSPKLLSLIYSQLLKFH